MKSSFIIHPWLIAKLEGLVPDRESAFELLQQYTKSESLIKHMLAVEACMRAYAEKFGEDGEKWGIVGLLHDFDYEMYPNPPDHPGKGAAILKEAGYPDDLIYAIKSHAEWTNCPRQSLMDKALFACDELSGFITAVVLVRPDKKIQGLEARSVTKKMKDKAFARAVSRDDIANGAKGLGIELDEHITFCIRAMEKAAHKLGL
jgi:putative nucleotidyltransferase with HDIG domain